MAKKLHPLFNIRAEHRQIQSSELSEEQIRFISERIRSDQEGSDMFEVSLRLHHEGIPKSHRKLRLIHPSDIGRILIKATVDEELIDIVDISPRHEIVAGNEIQSTTEFDTFSMLELVSEKEQRIALRKSGIQDYLRIKRDRAASISKRSFATYASFGPKYADWVINDPCKRSTSGELDDVNLKFICVISKNLKELRSIRLMADYQYAYRTVKRLAPKKIRFPSLVQQLLIEGL